jgi:hypothetical protein
MGEPEAPGCGKADQDQTFPGIKLGLSHYYYILFYIVKKSAAKYAYMF